jgi:hypothetical protein
MDLFILFLFLFLFYFIFIFIYYYKMSCNCCYPEYYTHYDYSNYPEYYTHYDYSDYPEYTEDFKFKKPNIGKVFHDIKKGVEKVGNVIKDAIPNPAELAKYGNEILDKIEAVMRTLGFNDIADIINDIQKLIPVNNIITLSKTLADKLLQFIIGKVITMLPAGAIIKPLFSKFIWPRIKVMAIDKLRSLIKQIKLPGINYSLAIETFIYENYNSYGQLEYHSDIYEGYNSPCSEYVDDDN